MDIFKEIRERADILGIRFNRSYKAICPFPITNKKQHLSQYIQVKIYFIVLGVGKKETQLH